MQANGKEMEDFQSCSTCGPLYNDGFLQLFGEG